jgi:hypothetical protein
MVNSPFSIFAKTCNKGGGWGAGAVPENLTNVTVGVVGCVHRVSGAHHKPVRTLQLSIRYSPKPV